MGGGVKLVLALLSINRLIALGEQGLIGVFPPHSLPALPQVTIDQFGKLEIVLSCHPSQQSVLQVPPIPSKLQSPDWG